MSQVGSQKAGSTAEEMVVYYAHICKGEDMLAIHTTWQDYMLQIG